MQFSTDRFRVERTGSGVHARPSRRITVALPALIYGIVLVVATGVLARGAGGNGLPDAQVASGPQLNENVGSPVEVVDAFLAAQSVDAVDAAAAFFETDASITDSSGRSISGADGIRRLIGSLNGWEAGPRQAAGPQVVWAESLPIWQLTGADLMQLEQEVPHYAAVQVMCAVVTDGKIHALIALPAGSPRSC